MPDGSMYDGLFENGEKHGRGKLTFKDFSTFEGEFVNDNI
jgi:hypothetical protein